MMPRARMPRNEVERLNALAALRILDTPADPAFDRITRLTARRFNLPIALISFIDSERQWFKSRLGVALSETPRSLAFCAHTILHKGVLHIADARKDLRFAESPLVLDAPLIRFYAGAPLTVNGNCRVGTLCVLDREPRDFSSGDREDLAALAALVTGALEARVPSNPDARTASRLAIIERINHVTATTRNADTAVAETLRALTDFTGADIVVLRTPGRADDDPQLSFAAGAVDPELSAVCNRLSAIDSPLARRLGAGQGGDRKGFAVADLDYADLIRRGDYALLREHGIRSVFSVPVELDGERLSLLFLFRAPQPDANAMAAEMAALALQIGLFLQRKQIEDGLRRTTHSAETSNRAKLEFMAVMSHEFRTPLNAVIGFSEMMTRGMFGPLNKRYLDYAHYIHRSGRHLLRIVGDILDLAKIESGSFELCRAPVDLAELVETCLQLLAHRAAEGQLTFARAIDLTACPAPMSTRSG